MNTKTKVGNRQLSQQTFIDRANKVHNYKYNYHLVLYTKMRNKVIIICPIHGEFLQTPDKHINGNQGCPDCSKIKAGISRRVKVEDFIAQASQIHNNKYNYKFVEYTTTHKNVVIICPIHGNFAQAPANHLKGRGCTKCKYDTIGNKARLSLEDFVTKATSVWGNKFDYSQVEYRGNDTKVLIKCNKHNIEFWQVPSSHYTQSGCKKCKVKSKGESYISSWLDKYKIYYETEKSFSGCILKNAKKPLRFDFYLPSLNLLIEYDGEQHYKESIRWGWGKKSIDKFEEIKQRDLFKTNWARDNGYKLLRIPYFEFNNIGSILDLEITNGFY